MIILGTGAHAKDVYFDLKEKDGVSFFNNEQTVTDDFFNCFEILNDLDIPPKTFHLGVGNPVHRLRLSKLAEYHNHIPVNVFGDSIIKYNVEFKKGITILSDSIIESDSSIGNYCLIHHKVMIGHNTMIKDHVVISPMAYVGSYSKIGSNCFLGSNCTLLSNIEICDNVTIGAGSVVTKNIQEKGTYVGNPARKIK